MCPACEAQVREKQWQQKALAVWAIQHNDWIQQLCHNQSRNATGHWTALADNTKSVSWSAQSVCSLVDDSVVLMTGLSHTALHYYTAWYKRPVSVKYQPLKPRPTFNYVGAYMSQQTELADITQLVETMTWNRQILWQKSLLTGHACTNYNTGIWRDSSLHQDVGTKLATDDTGLQDQRWIKSNIPRWTC